MKVFVVVEVVFIRYPPTIWKHLLGLQGRSEAHWDFELSDTYGGKKSAYGNATVFLREDAARKAFRKSAGIGWPGSSVYLIFANSFTRRGAVQRAIGNLTGGSKRGEVLDEQHHGNGSATAQVSEASHGNS